MDTLKITNLMVLPDKLVQSFNNIPDNKYLNTSFPYRWRCYEAITGVNTSNMGGDISVLLNAKDHTKIVFEGMLYPGMQIISSSKAFAYYPANITPKIPGNVFRNPLIATSTAI